MMRRDITSNQTRELLARIRDEVPDIHIRTTFMVGHPDETDDDFAELCDFVKEARFERMGAFAYSHEHGTYSFENHEDNIPDEVKQQRLDRLMNIQQAIAEEVNEQKVGKILKTIIDRREGEYFIGRTEYDSPEIDPEIIIGGKKNLKQGEFYNILINRAEAFELYGEPAKK
jgi:ribosomal protein S12 methylthiotransferase